MMSGADWSARLVQLEDRFRAAREAGQQNDPEEYLSELLADQSFASDLSELANGQWLHVVALIRLILIDLEASVEGRPATDQAAFATEYLERYPLLRECLPVIQELFVREFQVRRRCGTIQSWAQFLSLVPPDFRHRLRPAPRYWCRPWAVLGEGTFGEVFTAMDEELGREVAFKIQKKLSTRHDDEPEQRDWEHQDWDRRKFQWEATVTSQLEHPSVVPMYGFETTDDGRLGYAMRKLQWQTLDDKIRQFHGNTSDGQSEQSELGRQSGQGGQIGLSDSVSHELDPAANHRQKFSRLNESFEDLLVPFATACDAIGFAHQRGFLNNDIKPKHIAIGDKGETVVLDWGNARTFEVRRAASRVELQDQAQRQSDNTFATEDAQKETLLPSATPRDMEPADPHETREPDLTLPNALHNSEQADDAWPLEYGTVLGTPAYISPEMWAGRGPEIGAASDVYSLGATLYELLTGKPPNVLSASNAASPSPHLTDSRIPRPLSAICMRCLHDQPSRRYPSAELVAKDIRNWLADRMVDAYGESPWERLVRWVRHRTTELLYSVMTIVSIALVILGAWWFFVTQMRRDEVFDLAIDLREHAAENVYEPIYALHRNLDFSAPLLRDLITDTEQEMLRRSPQDPEADASDRRWLHRLRLVLLKTDGAQTQRLADGDWIRSDLPEYLLTHNIVTELDRQSPLPNREQLIAFLWQTVDADDLTRLRAACVLARLDIDEEAWSHNNRSQHVVQSLLTATRRFDLLAIELLSPIRHRFLDDLKHAFRDPDTPADQRQIAADALASYLAAQGDFPKDQANLDELLGLLVDSTAQQFKSLIDRVKQYNGAQYGSQATQRLAQKLADERLSSRQRAIAATALMQIQRGQFNWELFQFTSDPSLRTELIHLLADLDTDPEILLQQLEQESASVPDHLAAVSSRRRETRASIRHGLILALGRYPPGELPPRTVNVLRNCWNRDWDAGVHAAAEWGLRKLRDGDWILQQLSRTEYSPREKESWNRSWWINSQGQTMIGVAADPVPCHMGAHDEEKAYDSSIEPKFQATIVRPYAIAATETTVRQFERFYPGYRRLMDQERTKDDTQSKTVDQLEEPISFVPFAHAAAYCNWLSEQDGIPPDQWCYRVELAPTMIEERWPEQTYDAHYETEYLFQDRPSSSVDLTKTGYRLPTEIEWEYACRFRTTSTWFFGSNRAFLPSYALHRDNAGGPRLGPTAVRMPNRLGLFDVLGNAAEWCLDLRWTKSRLPVGETSYRDGPQAVMSSSFEDDFAIASPEDYEEEIAVRGGSFHDFGVVVRPSYRIAQRLSRRDQGIGFRVVRTLPSDFKFAPLEPHP